MGVVILLAHVCSRREGKATMKTSQPLIFISGLNS
jgi:hypothetical protein